MQSGIQQRRRALRAQVQGPMLMAVPGHVTAATCQWCATCECKWSEGTRSSRCLAEPKAALHVPSTAVTSSRAGLGVQPSCRRCQWVSSWSVWQEVVHKVPDVRELFQATYRHFLRLADADVRSNPELADRHQAGEDAVPARLEANAVADRVLCVRAMGALYAVHAGRIGELLLLLLLLLLFMYFGLQMRLNLLVHAWLSCM